MRCYYHYDEATKKKYLIPHCYESLHREDKKCCTCSPLDKSFEYYEKEKFNIEVARLKKELEYFISENERLTDLLIQKKQPLTKLSDGSDK